MYGSSLGTPFLSGQASSRSRIPSPSRSFGFSGTGNGFFCIADIHSIEASALSSGVPNPRVMPGPTPAPKRHDSPAS